MLTGVAGICPSSTPYCVGMVVGTRVRTGHAEILGGGLAGLTVAASLAQGGWTVRVHERNTTLREIGAGIVLWQNVIWVLEGIGVLEDATKRAQHVYDWEVRDHRDRSILPRGWLFSRLKQRSAMTVLRQDVHRALVTACQCAGVALVTDSEVVEATPKGELTLGTGERLRADLIVAADGVRSKIRESLKLTKRAWPLGAGVARHLAEGHEQLREAELVEWMCDRRRVGVYPNKDYTYFYTWCADNDTAGRNPELEVATWSESFPQLAELFSRATQSFPWSGYRQVECHSWSAGKVALVGDAAHAMSADLGQGANCAMSNAFALGRAVLSADTLPSALGRWEQAERPQTEARQRCSRAFTNANLRWPRALLPVRATILRRAPVTRRWASKVAELADYTPDAATGS